MGEAVVVKRMSLGPIQRINLLQALVSRAAGEKIPVAKLIELVQAFDGLPRISSCAAAKLGYELRHQELINAVVRFVMRMTPGASYTEAYALYREQAPQHGVDRLVSLKRFKNRALDSYGERDEDPGLIKIVPLRPFGVTPPLFGGSEPVASQERLA